MNEDQEKMELRLDESNELFFKISIHGAERAPDSIRLVCESGDVSYSFKGKATAEPDVIRFVVPPMKDIKRGQVCESRVEVIVDSHYFVPVKFSAEFTEPVKVVAEALTPVKRTPPAAPKAEITIQAAPVSKAQYTSLRDKYRAGAK